MRVLPGIAQVSLFKPNIRKNLTLGNVRTPCVTKKSEKAPTCPYFYEEKNPENRSDEATAGSHRTIYE